MYGVNPVPEVRTLDTVENTPAVGPESRQQYKNIKIALEMRLKKKKKNYFVAPNSSLETEVPSRSVFRLPCGV